MKVFFVPMVLMAVTLVPVTGQASDSRPDSNAKAAQEVVQLEHDWVTASIKRDKAWLENFFADEFVSTHPTSGAVKNKTQEIADTIDPTMAVESMALGEMQARIAGDVAIVIGNSSELGGGGHLKDRSRCYLFTDTFIRRDGRWQLLASHSSRAKCPSPE